MSATSLKKLINHISSSKKVTTAIPHIDNLILTSSIKYLFQTTLKIAQGGNKMNNTIYIINWEILRSGRIREYSTFDYKEYKDMIRTIEKSDRYKLIEFYALYLEDYSTLKNLEK